MGGFSSSLWNPVGFSTPSAWLLESCDTICDVNNEQLFNISIGVHIYIYISLDKKRGSEHFVLQKPRLHFTTRLLTNSVRTYVHGIGVHLMPNYKHFGALPWIMLDAFVFPYHHRRRISRQLLIRCFRPYCSAYRHSGEPGCRTSITRVMAIDLTTDHWWSSLFAN